MEIVIQLSDAYIARLDALVDAMNASPTRRDYSPIWTAESAVTVAAINGLKEMESRYIEWVDV